MKVKKIMAFTLCAAAAAGILLTGCGSSSSNNATSSGSGSSSAFDKNSDISVVSREDGSGTRGAFIELFGVQQVNAKGEKEDMTTSDASIANSTGVMMTTVAGNEYAIGYSSLGALNDTVKAVTVDGVEATTANVSSGTYKIARPFNIVVSTKVSNVTQDFIDYILSKDGQEVVSSDGYISIADSDTFKTSSASGKVVVAGSSSVSPLMEKLKEAYEKVNKNAQVEIQTSDSTTGISAASQGTCDIGMASRELDSSEKSSKLKVVQIATDGIAVIVNKDNPITNLTSDQVKKIYTGETTSWADVSK